MIPQNQPTYMDPGQPIEARINDLISRFTREEKVSLLMYESPAIPRLNIPEYNWWNEALHGVGRSGKATVFPQAVGLGATFDTDLMYRIATAISDEARAIYNETNKKGYRLQYNGLTFWTPNINIYRDPRWGRGQETYGEDPHLTARMGVAFVKGMQGDHPRYMKTATAAKHFAVHSGPEKLRHEFDAITTPRDLHETYLPAFKALVEEAQVEGVMCAYNRTNGSPCCANQYLLQDILRNKWQFDGYIVTDCWALVDLYEGHRVTGDKVQAAAMALEHGINLNCGNVYPNLIEALNNGLVTEEQIDQALYHNLQTRFRLGMFDPQGKNPYDKITTDVINTPEHRALSREAAQKSIVMLKNNGVLPLQKDLSEYYVTGPNATNLDVLLGNYYGVNPVMVTFLEGITDEVNHASKIQYKTGTMLNQEKVNPIDWNTEIAAYAEATIVCIGLAPVLEGEEGEAIASEHLGDRLDYHIPRNQVQYLRELREAAPDKPIISVITGGSPMDMAEINELSDAVLLAWYPGQEGGHAVADIIFGNVSPSGRLPVTFPKSLDQLPPYEDYNMKGRTYRYMDQEPLYAFGYGLSYADFEYKNLKLSASTLKANEEITVRADISNMSDIKADEVVQLYVSYVNSAVSRPIKELKDFSRVTLGPGETKTVSLTLKSDDLRYWDEDKNTFVLEQGKVEVMLGKASDHLLLKQTVDVGDPVFSVGTSEDKH